MYATPEDTIFKVNEWPSDSSSAINDLRKSLNEVEQILFAKILLLEDQYEKYKDIGHIIYNGSSIDILVNALILCEQGYISEEFTEKVIYHNKKMLRNIDVIYLMPDESINEKSDDDLKILESVYWNLYENYQTEFATSPFFDQKNCASIFLINNKNPLGEVKMLLDKNGNLETTSYGGKDDNIIDTSNLKNILKNNPELLDAALNSLKSNSSLNVRFYYFIKSLAPNKIGAKLLKIFDLC